MGSLDENNVYVYDETDQISPLHAYINLGMASVSEALTDIKAHSLIKPVATAAERDAYAKAMTDAGNPPTPEHPLYVDRYDEWVLEANRGDGWEMIGGRQHGATITFSHGAVGPRKVSEMHLDTFQRRSIGFAADADTLNLILPSTGLWLINLTVEVEGTVPPGRGFAEIMLNNATNLARFPAYNEDRWTGSLLYALNKSDKLKVQVYHSASENRKMTGYMNITRVSAPKWT